MDIMNDRKGFFVLPIIILVVGLIVIGAGYFYLSNTPQPTTDKSKKEQPPPKQQGMTGSPTPSNTAGNETPQPSPTIIEITTKNCGSIITNTLTGKPTAQEKASLNCFSQAMLACTPASIEFKTDAITMEVLRKEGQNCVIKDTKSKDAKTCNIPISIIQNLKEYSAKQGEPIENLFMPISFLIGFEKATDTKTGKTIDIACSK
jgi:hypothetical protein